MVRRMRQPLQMSVSALISAPDAPIKSVDANGLVLSQGLVPAMVQGHGHGGEFWGFVQAFVVPFRPAFRLMGSIGLVCSQSVL